MTFSVSPAAWDDVDSADIDVSTPLGACCHGSRLIGREASLVLHGGGNTSVKTQWADITGRTVDALYVKGSGWNLATIEPAGFTPLVMERLWQLLDLDRLADEDMARELAAAKLDPAAPAPSVESLLHAFLPFDAVQHSHADVIVALTNTSDGEANVREVFGTDVVVIPYVMPGFDLARLVKGEWPKQYRPGITGMVLLNHGLFTFGESTEIAYRRHVELIMRAQEWLNAKPVSAETTHRSPVFLPVDPVERSHLRSLISDAAGTPMIVAGHRDDAVADFVGRDDMESLASRGPLTPDHVIRTKRLPLIGSDVSGYAHDYQRYFRTNSAHYDRELTMLDPAPRVVLDRRLGMLTVGRTAGDASIVEDIYRHTMVTAAAVEDRLDGYHALSAAELFDVEYWDLEQAKLRRSGNPPSLTGEVALVTGAASGIGRACVARLLEEGAAVIGLDRSEAVVDAFDSTGFLGVTCDVTDTATTEAAVVNGVERFGGIDMALMAAGVFPESRPVADYDHHSWRETMALNIDSVAALLSRLHPILANAPNYGRVVLVGSKNALAPGPGAGTYSVSKAALTQLARVSALEWGADHIRVNVVHPDAVFDTGLWSPELIEERARHYGLSVDDYKTRNILKTEVTSASVAELVVAMCGPAFAATTGAQVPIDGGNDRVI